LGRRIVDRHMLWLIKLWLRTPVEERDGDGGRRMSGGRAMRAGPQGGVASPSLSVFYMNRFLRHWRQTERGEPFRGHVVSDADDFVILSRGHADETLTWTGAVMTKLGLKHNETKTSVKDARREGFDFLGYTLGPRHLPNGRALVSGGEPVQEECAADQAEGRRLLTSDNKGAWDEVRARLARVLRGWSACFSYGTLASGFEAVDQHVYDRTRHFLRQRHKVQGRGMGWTGSPESMSTGNRPCYASDASAGGRRRGSCGDASRKAECGKSARPVVLQQRPARLAGDKPAGQGSEPRSFG
jgi:RNA-directed DNA polymerase